MENYRINTSFEELTVVEMTQIDGGKFKEFLEGLDFLNQKWDAWKKSFIEGWNSYPY